MDIEFDFERLGIVLLALWLSGLAVWAGARPRAMMSWLEEFWSSGDRLGWVVGIRAAIGAYLLWIADATPLPLAVGGVGLCFLCAAAAVVLMGRERVDRWVAWWVASPTLAARGIAVAWIAFASFLAYAGLAHA